MRCSTLIALVGTMAVVGHAQDSKIISGGGYNARILGQSGKIVVGKTENPSQDPNGVVIEFDALREIDAEGNAVGTSGSVKHSFESFASQDFSFGSIYETTLGTAKAAAFDFSSTLVEQANLTITVFMVTEAGEFTVDESNYNLTQGALKFNVGLVNWPFCEADGQGPTLCKKGNVNEVGSGLELDISIKANKSGAKVVPTDGEDEYKLDANTYLSLTSSVEIDGASVPMGADYPKISTKGSREVFTFRFPKFDSSMVYDPIIGFSGSLQGTEDTTPGGADDTKTSAPTSAAAFLLPSLMAFFGARFLM